MQGLSKDNAVVGTRRLLKAIEAGRVSLAYVADDADLMIKTKLRAACDKHGVRMVEADSMVALGKACGIDVPSASAGVLK